MNTSAITLLALGTEPSELDAWVHALKNCVSVIVGLASTIERQADPVARARATQLVQTSQRLKDLLKVPSRRDSAYQHRESVAIEDLLRVVSERLAPQAENASVRLAIDCAGGAIRGEFAELAESLYNLASNSIQASVPGGTVRIATRQNQDGDHEWSVEDAGAGIPASMMPRLGSMRVTTRPDGTGLGLSLALQVVRRHHGVMRIESAEGSGTTVRIWLPGRAR